MSEAVFAAQLIRSGSPARSDSRPRASSAYSAYPPSAISKCCSFIGGPPSGSFRGKRHYLIDVPRAGCDHDGAVEAQRHAGAAREPCAERGEKRLVRRVAREAGARALRSVARKASGLLGCIAELIESVRQLDRAPEGLEAGGNGSFDPCQRRLRRWEGVQEGDPVGRKGG